MRCHRVQRQLRSQLPHRPYNLTFSYCPTYYLSSGRPYSSTSYSPSQPGNATTGVATKTDVLIIGAGGAGLLAALRCHHHGLKPLIIEKTDKVGGASAYSGGALWIPNNHLQKPQEDGDSPVKALQYLNGLIGDEVGPASSLERRQAYVDSAPQMARFLSALGFRWRPSKGYPDYHPELPGGQEQGRSIEGDVFDIRQLGEWRQHLNLSPSYPIPPLFGYEAGIITRAGTSLAAFGSLMRVLLRFVTHKALGREAATLGVSLVGQLLALNLKHGTTIWRNSPLESLLNGPDGSIVGAVITHDGQKKEVLAKYGVLLCAGGFAKNQKMREEYQEGPVNTSWSSVPPGDTGDAIQAGMAVNAATALMDDAWWGPTMMDPVTGPYFALWDRARPSSICVDAAGQRFMNEAESYVDAVHHQYERHRKIKAIPAWMIVDSNFRRRYPISTLLPRASPKSAIESGFLFMGDTLDELAQKIGVDKDGLSKTITRFNYMAKRGIDEDFGRGSTAYHRFFGDPTSVPNACLGPIERPPFYAVKMYPGDLGTKGGLLTDAHGRVLDKQQHEPIRGLYASGNTTASMMGRRYAGAGATLGPALTFAYIAVDHMGRAAQSHNGTGPVFGVGQHTQIRKLHIGFAAKSTRNKPSPSTLAPPNMATHYEAHIKSNAKARENVKFLRSTSLRITPRTHLDSGTIRGYRHRLFSTKSSPDEHTKNYDVVVVGFGAAGACAAISAAEKGARVLVLDRALGGGASALSGGVVYAGGGTRQQREAGHGNDSPEDMYKYLAQEVWGSGVYEYPSPTPSQASKTDNSTIQEHGPISAATLKEFCDGSVAMIQWLEGHGARFEGSLCPYKTSYPTDEHYLYYSGNESAWPYNQHAKPHPRGHRTVAKGMTCGAVLMGHLHDAAVRLGVEIRPFSRAERLIFDESKQIVGICFRTVQKHDPAFKRLSRLSPFQPLSNILPWLGRQIEQYSNATWERAATQVEASAAAVVLAAGGFVYNPEMVAEHLPKYHGVQPLGTPADDGDGIRLGQSVGGSVAFMDKMSAWRFISPPPALMQGIVVDANGQRIANEDLYGAAFTEALIHRADGKGYLIVDSVTWDKAKSSIDKDVIASLKLPTKWLFAFGHKKAHTLEELASKLGISASELTRTTNAYNEGVASGKGDPYHKNPSLCSIISQGPYYAIDISVPAKGRLDGFVPGITLGGLRVDGQSGLVLNESGAPISGLYAAGRTAVGICSNSYVSGLSLADCVFSGRRAGNHAAEIQSFGVGVEKTLII
jgi:succinate dehydrogenase/fumarate reductase flavoprotein subunit